MSKLQEPFRYDYVGSFLRTEELKKATTQYNENKITKEVYDNIVNEEIAKLVSKTKRIRISCDYGRRVQKNLLAFRFYVGI